jgi:hypothetical protein
MTFEHSVQGSRVKDPQRELLRHMLATLAYRGGKALRGVPDHFAEYRASRDARTPGQILAHIADLLDWGLSQVKGKEAWHDSPALPWPDGASRFFAALQALDSYVASEEPLAGNVPQLFQGAIADAFTHVGQINILRRLAGCPVRAENYSRAEIVIGRVTDEQAAPTREF